MSTSPNASKPKAAAPPAVLPVPGGIFFCETLPLDAATAKSTAAIEALVQLSLESHSPLPPDQLAHGWRTFTPPAPAKKPATTTAGNAPAGADGDAKQPKPAKPAAALPGTLFYYAAAKERLREAANGNYDRASFIIPDVILAPDNTPDVWHWLATPAALTAVRFNADSPLPADVKSWQLNNADDAAAPLSLEARIAAERALRENLCEGGSHAPTLFWLGATINGTKTISARWQPAGDGSVNGSVDAAGTAAIRTATLNLADAWNADPRDRAWLARERKNRDARRNIKLATFGAAALWVLIAFAGIALVFFKKHVKSEHSRAESLKAEVAAFEEKRGLLNRLDELKASEEAARPSFFDTLAALNHLRPTTQITFADAKYTPKVFPNQIAITGSAPSLDKVNEFIEKIRRDPQFASVTEPNYQTRPGQGALAAGALSSFDFRVTVGKVDVERSSPPPTVDEIISETKEIINETKPKVQSSKLKVQGSPEPPVKSPAPPAPPAKNP